MIVKCHKENSTLKEGLPAYYNDPAFYEECKMGFLKEREEFRKIGISAKKRLTEASHKHVGKYSSDTQELQYSWTSFIV
uniref:Uncharacterized protein n=1 Tax=Prolemur simus TaxID=1328070 RepID=A0A8C9AN81_PROSS